MKQTQLEVTGTNFSQKLEEVFDAAASGIISEKAKGDWLEKAVVLALNSEGGKRLWQLEWACLWGDWDGSKDIYTGDMPDLGIDVVAKKRTGEMIAIQCKARNEDYKIPKKDIEAVIAMATPDKWSSILVIHTGGGWTSNAKKLAGLQDGRLQVINRLQFQRWCEDWGLIFPEFGEKWPSVLASVSQKFEMRPHQEKAVADVIDGFSNACRGKLIMPCGSGKTFTSQNIAEQLVGAGGSVIVAVPSISLLSQSMREWSRQQNGIPHRYLGVCSDKAAGTTHEDEFSQEIYELDVPVTTKSDVLAEQMSRETPDEMLVIFTTYQSLPKVKKAQDKSGIVFDLALLDEAHRTTGLAEAGLSKSQKNNMKKELSSFRRVHDNDWLKINKRLYLTATPKIYKEPRSDRALKAGEDNVYSMQDVDVYGKDFHHLTFKEAVDQELLAPYKVVLVGVKDTEEAERLRKHIARVRSEQTGKEEEIDGELAAKILGATKFACNYSDENESEPRQGEGILKKMLVFTNTIKDSNAAAAGFDFGDDMLAELDENFSDYGVEVEAIHVDGTMGADEREKYLDWLKKSEDPNLCRVLSNARCLSEGIDVPALDGCVFLYGRKSKVDVVQAVGRIMRKAANKKQGWVILPVLTSIPEDETSADDVQKYISKQWKPAWDVLRALAAHDEDFRLEIAANAASLAGGKQVEANNGGKLITGGTLSENNQDNEDSMVKELQTKLALENWEQVSALIYPVIVKELGGTQDLNKAGILAGKLIDEVRSEIRSIKRGENEKAKKALEDYWLGMRSATSSDVLTKDDVDVMLSQHIVMEPVFNSFFKGQFAASNPVSRILEDLLAELQKSGFDLAEKSRRKLEGFYKYVDAQVQKMDSPSAFQGFLKEVYNAFFRTAFKETADQLGIAYTPIEIVDFINKSADWVSRQAFGKGIGDREVGVMDPFTGTGTFLARMLADETLISDTQVDHKYAEELFAYEVVLLAYYIASINIEQAYHQRKGTKGRQADSPFEGIVLHDTFAGFGMKGKLAGLDGNSRRARAIESKEVEIVVGNPPYSSGAKTAGQDSQNIRHELLENKIRNEVAPLITQSVTNIGMLYNSYVHALVWSEHRLGEKGVISFVMPDDWMWTKSGEGIRRWVEAKFSEVWILDTKGQKGSGEAGKQQGRNIFEEPETKTSPCTSRIGIFVFVKDTSHSKPCQVHYHAVPDGMKAKDKRDWVGKVARVDNITDWKRLSCDEKGRWFGETVGNWDEWIPVASKSCKAGKDDNAIFRMHSLGLASGRDYLAFNSDYDQMCDSAKAAVEEYERVRLLRNAGQKSDLSANIDVFKWGKRPLDCLGQNGNQGVEAFFDEQINIRPVMYRPFFPQWVHWENIFNSRHYQLETAFPTGNGSTRTPTSEEHIQLETLPVDNCGTPPKTSEKPAAITAEESTHTHTHTHQEFPAIIWDSHTQSSRATYRTPDLHELGGQTNCLPRFIFRTSESSEQRTLSTSQQHLQTEGSAASHRRVFSRDGLSVRTSEGGGFGADVDDSEQDTDLGGCDGDGAHFSRPEHDIFASPICLPPEFARGCL